jgi:hypothetical protein
MNLSDITNANQILEGLATIHHDKVRFGQIKA